MPFARKYESFEVRQLLRDAEGRASPVTGAAGHSKGLHAMSHGGLTKNDQLARVTRLGTESNRAFRQRGGTTQTGAFSTMVHQASAACSALNSTPGQAALAVLDDPAHAGVNIRLELNVSGIKEAGFLPESTAPHTTNVRQGDVNVTTASTAGVKMFIDRAANGTFMQIQTCYPLQNPFNSSWQASNATNRTVLAAG